MKVITKSAHHNVFVVKMDEERQVKISSDFDSGNMHKVEFGHPNVLIMTPANDCAGTQYESHSKSWFHFRVSSLPLHTTLKFVIKSVHMLASQTRFSEHYKAVYKYKGDDWKRVARCLVMTKEDDTQLHFQHRFDKTVETTFAFTYPHSYEQSQHFIHTVSKQMSPSKDIYFHNEVIIQSVQGRNINLVTISSIEGRENTRQAKINQFLFPAGNIRAHRFRSSKKVVLLTARVHPGETPSSHTINGAIKFLLSKDARAEVLRKYFVFMLVPMLNPDGVYQGHYRMDTLNQNLNRFYLEPNPKSQPGPFAVRSLTQYLNTENRLFFYIDLHAHAGKKGNFFYGNALQDFAQQVQTQLFARLLSLNCVNFEYENCNFTMKQMTSKDRNQQMTKEGCGRVVLQKLANLTYSYTLECGYHQSSMLNDLPVAVNGHRKIKKMGLVVDDFDNTKSQIYAEGIPYFSIQLYENVGRSLIITILDIFNKNPFSRVPNSTYKNIENLRKEVGQEVKRAERFQNRDKVMAYRSKRLAEGSKNYTPISDEFERQGVFELKANKALENSRRVSANTSIRPERRRMGSIRVRELTHPKFYLARLPLSSQAQ